jgi:hypothetical protein
MIVHGARLGLPWISQSHAHTDSWQANSRPQDTLRPLCDPGNTHRDSWQPKSLEGHTSTLCEPGYLATLILFRKKKAIFRWSRVDVQGTEAW